MENKPREKKDSEMYKKMNDIYAKIYPDTSMKMKHCQYRAKSGDRYCLMTTLKSCENCRHFTPTTQSKIRILVEYISKLEQENKKLNYDLVRREGDIRELKYTLSLLREKP